MLWKWWKNTAIWFTWWKQNMVLQDTKPLLTVVSNTCFLLNCFCCVSFFFLLSNLSFWHLILNVVRQLSPRAFFLWDDISFAFGGLSKYTLPLSLLEKRNLCTVRVPWSAPKFFLFQTVYEISFYKKWKLRCCPAFHLHSVCECTGGEKSAWLNLGLIISCIGRQFLWHLYFFSNSRFWALNLVVNFNFF